MQNVILYLFALPQRRVIIVSVSRAVGKVTILTLVKLNNWP